METKKNALFLRRIMFVFTLCLFVCNNAHPEGKEKIRVGSLYYNLDENSREASVTSNNESASKEIAAKYVTGHLDIPSTINYNGMVYKVTSIGKYAFMNCINLTSVSIPNSIVNIEYCAFGWCSHLVSANIPKSVKNIKEGSFHGCGFRSIVIPPNVERVGKTAFEFCRELEEISFPPVPVQIGPMAFGHCDKLSRINGLWDGIKFYEDDIFKDKYFARSGRFDLWTADSLKASFDYIVNSYVIKKTNEWQKKRDFETTEQFQARVTRENQEKKINEFQQDAIKEYVKGHPLKVELGDYDADYGLFSVNSNYGQKYVKIPTTSAQTFKNNFNRATFNASYVITDSGLTINDLSIRLLGKVYYAEKTAVETSTTSINIELPDVIIPQNARPQQNVAQTPVTIDKSIDQDIPLGITGNSKTFAVIIGNEKYTQVAQVPYANNDAKMFAEYCKKTLGLPAQNVRTYENATFGMMLSAVNDIKKIAEAYQSEINVIIYYAGHGVPNEATKDAYLLPADADGRQTEVCYPVSRLYKELGEMGAKTVVVFMDACFSGAQRGEGMLASARGVAIKAKANNPEGNMVVFSAATGDETAYPYKEKGHGLFTYFLLKKLQESKGDCTLGELSEYIQTNVRQQSVVVNRKSQTPTIVPSSSMVNSWKDIKLK